jgi:hypothetical protein
MTDFSPAFYTDFDIFLDCLFSLPFRSTDNNVLTEEQMGFSSLDTKSSHILAENLLNCRGRRFFSQNVA